MEKQNPAGACHSKWCQLCQCLLNMLFWWSRTGHEKNNELGSLEYQIEFVLLILWIVFVPMGYDNEVHRIWVLSFLKEILSFFRD